MKSSPTQRSKRPPDSKEAATSIRRKLLAWYDRHHRPLPWRLTNDPYRIWISEVMLQQTRAQAVIPYYEKFLLRFPNVKTLARAEEQELLACWAGLGYYSRARNLQKAAQEIVSRHEGRFPHDVENALRLPGIGDYTAAAVLSIAYGVTLPVLDGNVARVLSRLFALSADLRTGSGRELLRRRAAKLLSPRRPGDFNQALMELGATACLPRQPQCPCCPVRSNCQALARDKVEKYPPVRVKSRPILRRFIAAVILDEKQRCLVVRRPADARWMAGFWELPMQEEAHTKHLSRHLNPMSEHEIVLGQLLGSVRHTITTNKLHVRVFRGSLDRAAIQPREQWVSFSEVELLPVTTITRKALRLAAAIAAE